MLKRLLADRAPVPYRAVRGETSLLVAIFALGETLRLLGIRLGLPFVHHWDEVLVTSSARSMIEHGNDLPVNYFYGAPLMRLVVYAYRVAQLLHLPGSHTGPPGEELYLRAIGRPVSATLAASGTFAVYLAARMIWRRGSAALWTALLYAASAELVWHARYLVTDAAVVALTAWTLALSAAYVEKRLLSLGLAAAVLAGLTFAFKLTGLATIVMPATVLALYPARGLLRRESSSPWLALTQRALLVSCVPLALAVFLALNPHVKDDWRRAFSDWEGIARHYREGHVKPFCEREPGLPHLFAALWFIVAEALSTNMPLALLLSAVALFGLYVSLRDASTIVLLGIAHALAVVVGMAWPNRAFLVRMYLPALPILCVGFGGGVMALADALRRRVSLGNGGQIALVALVACLISGLNVREAIACQASSADARERAVDFVAAIARSEGHDVTLAMSPQVAAPDALGSHPSIRRILARPRVRTLADVPDASTASASGADFVIVASYRDLARIWPYQEMWPYKEVPGYEPVTRFDFNPYEERLDLVPTWDGYVSAIVLKRK